MGTIRDSGRPAAFQNQTHPNGLDLGRTVINSSLGVFQAEETATFLAGYAVMLNDASRIETSDGKSYLGIAKWNKTNQIYGKVVDEVIVPVAETPVHLRHANVSKVRVTVNGVVAAPTTDYIVSETNGTITAVTGGALDGATSAEVTYTYLITESMLQIHGRNFWNFLNEVSIQDNFATVITDAEMMFTTSYDSSASYQAGGALYVSGTQAGQTKGELTSVSTGDPVKVGEVLFPPNASDIFLGCRLVKGPAL